MYANAARVTVKFLIFDIFMVSFISGVSRNPSFTYQTFLKNYSRVFSALINRSSYTEYPINIPTDLVYNCNNFVYVLQGVKIASVDFSKLLPVYFSFNNFLKCTLLILNLFNTL